MTTDRDPLKEMYEQKYRPTPAPVTPPAPDSAEPHVVPDLGQGARGIPAPVTPPSASDWFTAAGRAARHHTGIEDELDRLRGGR